MRWWRLHKPVTIKDLNKVLTLGYGVELKEDNVIVVKQGTALFGRPVHHWYIYLKGKREGNSIKLTHWWVEEESLDSIHFHSPLVKYMFGDVTRSFKTPWYVKREMAHAAAQYLKRLDNTRKIKTKHTVPGVKQDAVQVNVLDNSTNTAQRKQHMPS